MQGCNQCSQTMAEVDNPPLVEMKNRAWGAVAKLLLPDRVPPDCEKRLKNRRVRSATKIVAGPALDYNVRAVGCRWLGN